MERSEEFYSYQGSYIPIELFNYYRSEKISDTEIWMNHAKEFKKTIAKQKKEKRSKTKIESIKELIEFLFSILPDEKVNKIKEKKQECKTMADIIKLFPDVYQPILKLRYDYDQNKSKEDAAYMKSLNKTIVEKLPGRYTVYNADAWIGE